MLNNQTLNPAQERELQKSFAAIIKNTKTTKRQISLNEFAKRLDITVKIKEFINSITPNI